MKGQGSGTGYRGALAGSELGEVGTLAKDSVNPV